MRKRAAPLGALASVALLVVGCGTMTPGSASPLAAVECVAILPLRDAYADATRAAAAIEDGRPADAAAMGASAKAKATAVVAGLPPVPTEPTTPLRNAILEATTTIGVFADLIASGASGPVASEEATTYLTAVSQVVGTADSIATAGLNGAPPACPGIEPLTAALPTVAPLPAGPVEMQQLSALAGLRLAPAIGVRFAMRARIRWNPGFVTTEDVTLDNGTGGAITVPLDLTALRWDGAAWRRQRCEDAATSDPVSGLCGVTNVNARVVEPGMHTSATDDGLFFMLHGTEPGTYALVLPVRHGSDEYPEGVPTEAAVAIVTITTVP